MGVHDGIDHTDVLLLTGCHVTYRVARLSNCVQGRAALTTRERKRRARRVCHGKLRICGDRVREVPVGVGLDGKQGVDRPTIVLSCGFGIGCKRQTIAVGSRDFRTSRYDATRERLQLTCC